MAFQLYVCSNDGVCDKSKLTVGSLLREIEVGIVDLYNQHEPPEDSEDAHDTSSFFDMYFWELRANIRKMSPAILNAPVNIIVGSAPEHPAAALKAGRRCVSRPMTDGRCETSERRCGEERPPWHRLSGPGYCPSEDEPEEQAQPDQEDDFGDHENDMVYSEVGKCWLPRVARPVSIRQDSAWYPPVPVLHPPTAPLPVSASTHIVSREGGPPSAIDENDSTSGLFGSYTTVSGSAIDLCDPDEEYKEQLKHEIIGELKCEVMAKMKAEILAEILAEMKITLEQQGRGQVTRTAEQLSDLQAATREELDSLARRVDKVDTIVRAEVEEAVAPLRLSYAQHLADALADIDIESKHQREINDSALKEMVATIDAAVTKGDRASRHLQELCQMMQKPDDEMESRYTEIRKEQEGIQENLDRTKADMSVLHHRLGNIVDLAKTATDDSSKLMLNTAEAIAQQVSGLLEKSKQHVQQSLVEILQQRAAAVDAIALHARSYGGHAMPMPPHPTLPPPAPSTEAASSVPSSTSTQSASKTVSRHRPPGKHSSLLVAHNKPTPPAGLRPVGSPVAASPPHEIDDWGSGW